MIEYLSSVKIPLTPVPHAFVLPLGKFWGIDNAGGHMTLLELVYTSFNRLFVAIKLQK